MNDSAKEEGTNKRGSDFLESWVCHLLSKEENPAVLPSKYWTNCMSSPSKDPSARIIIRGASKVIIPCHASGLAQIHRGITGHTDIYGFLKIQQELKFYIHVHLRSEEVDPDNVETLVLFITPTLYNDVHAVERGSLILLAWAMKVARDHEFSLLTHLKRHLTKEIPLQTPNRSELVNDSNAKLQRMLPGTKRHHSESVHDPNAAENDWQKYANTFQVTGDLERLIIEEAAKAEGDLRMVFDEMSGEVIGLGEFARRVNGRAKENRSLEVNDFEERVAGRIKQNRSEDLKYCDENHSVELNDSADRIGKRKLEEDIQAEEVNVEKKTRLDR
jgi:hypothetical protein